LLQGSSNRSLACAPHHSFALAPGAARAMDTGVAVAPRLVLPSQEAFMQSPQSLMSEPDPLHLRVVKHPVSVGFVKMDGDAWKPKEQGDSMCVWVGGGGRRRRSSGRKRLCLPAIAITVKAPMPAGDALPAHANIRTHTLIHAHTRLHTCLHACVLSRGVCVGGLGLGLGLYTCDCMRHCMCPCMFLVCLRASVFFPCLRASMAVGLFKLELVSWRLFDCMCTCLCASTCVCICGSSLR
jgi:hypothetical protein